MNDDNAIDLAHLRGWIGRTEEADDIVTPRLAASYRAMLEPHLAPVGPGEAPWMLHWCLTPPLGPMAALTDEGHLAKGGFLPPVPLPRRMWAGGAVEMRGALRVGDTVRRVSRVADVAVKGGRTGRLCFVTVQHEYFVKDAVIVAERQDIVYRDAPDTRGSGAPSPPVTEKPAAALTEADKVWTVDPSVAFLFRYSALTFNAHRIHYDLPYATQTEGYAGLVVHGPLQASLLFNLAAAAMGAPPRHFSYRGAAPLIASAPFEVCTSREADGSWRCWTRDGGGRTCMEARAAA